MGGIERIVDATSDEVEHWPDEVMRRNTFDVARQTYFELRRFKASVDKLERRVEALEKERDARVEATGGAGGKSGGPIDPTKFDRYGTVMGIALTILTIVLVFTGGRVT